MSIFESYNKNKGSATLLEECMILDWYDGLLTGMCRIRDTDKWVLCNARFIDFARSQRVLTLIEIDDKKFLYLKAKFQNGEALSHDEYANLKTEIRKIFLSHSGNVYLLKMASYDDRDYDMVEAPVGSLKYFESIEELNDQSENLERETLSFFKKR